jgi:hypothetical protein
VKGIKANAAFGTKFPTTFGRRKPKGETLSGPEGGLKSGKTDSGIYLRMRDSLPSDIQATDKRLLRSSESSVVAALR